MKSLELGLDTFGDVTRDANGAELSHAQVLRNLVEQAVLADELGVDFIGIGEHHRADFAVSAPEVVLAAIAARTRRIRLGSAVTVLSSDDPIRVFQRFSTVDALSGGRAEVIVGRGSFTESFPLFGYDLSLYEELFEQKLDLFVALLRQEKVTWSGRLRPPLTTVRFPHYQLGTEAAQLLLERIDQREAPVKILYLAPELVVRKSVTAPAGSAAQSGARDAGGTAHPAPVPLRRASSRRAGGTSRG